MFSGPKHSNGLNPTQGMRPQHQGPRPPATSETRAAMPYIKAGKVKALGVATAKKSSAMPDIPTIAEQGLKGYDVSVFFGVVAPKGTPDDRVQVLNKAFSKALDSDNVKKAFAAQGLEPSPDRSPAYLASFIKTEVDKWKTVVQQSGVTLD